jgi:hypothetical protein
MTLHRRMPSEVEPESLRDLVADCAELSKKLLRVRRVDLPVPRIDLTVPVGVPDVAIRLSEFVSEQVGRLADFYEYV